MKGYLKWIFTRWYFWLIVAIHSLFYIVSDIRTYGDVSIGTTLGAVIGAILVWFIIFLIGEGIYLLMNKIRKRK